MTTENQKSNAEQSKQLGYSKKTQENSSNCGERIEMVRKISGLPFVTVYDEETERIKIAFGKYIISEETFREHIDAEEYAKELSWDMIIGATAAMIEQYKEEQKKGQQ